MQITIDDKAFAVLSAGAATILGLVWRMYRHVMKTTETVESHDLELYGNEKRGEIGLVKEVRQLRSPSSPSSELPAEDLEPPRLPPFKRKR